MVTQDSVYSIELAFVRCMKCTNPFDSLGEILTYNYLQRSPDDEHDHTLGSEITKWKRSFPSVGEWFAAKLPSVIQESVGVVGTNNGIQSFTEALYWTQRKSDIKRFHRDGRMHTELGYATHIDDPAHFCYKGSFTFPSTECVYVA